MRSNGLNLEHGLNVEHDTIAVWNLAQIWSISREYNKRIKQMLSDSTKNVFRNTNNFLDPRLSESFENCLKIPKTVLDFWELFESSENCPRLPRTV